MQHLPPGYITGFGPARQSVLKLVRNVLKYARITLRNTVLKNVETNSLFKVTGNAPGLQLLYSLIASASLSLEPKLSLTQIGNTLNLA